MIMIIWKLWPRKNEMPPEKKENNDLTMTDRNTTWSEKSC